MSEERFEKTFNVLDVARLNLDNIRGSVDIRAGAAGIISITAVKQTDTGDAQNTTIELAQASDGTVTAATHFYEGWWLWLTGSKPCKVDYIVTAPKNCTLRVKGVSSKAFAEGFESRSDFNSVSGNLTLRNLAGSMRLNTVSGDVTGSALRGVLDLETVSGDVDLTEASLESVSAKTVSGNLRLETALASGPYNFNSVSGNVRLRLPADTHCNAELHTLSGKLSTAFPASNQSYGHGSQSVSVQGGGARVALQSVSGNLRLENAGGTQPVTAQAVAPAPVDRRAILERIERGEISAAEGLALLHG
jgi:hypothetical protein